MNESIHTQKGPKLMARMRFHSVHRGPLLGHPATDRQWVLGDLYGLLRQIAPDRL